VAIPICSKINPKIEKYDIVIIDPTSPDISRGSFCYLPYILYNNFKTEGKEVLLFENFTIFDLPTLPKADLYLIAFWSYSQTELCLVLKEFIPTENRESIQYFGYYPFVQNQGLPLFDVTDEIILTGIKTYPKYYSHFRSLLLCDDDMHLKKYEGTVYPVFLSYGCPQGCAFCSTSVNCKRKRLELSFEDCCKVLKQLNKRKIECIHFTDEDFFWDISLTYKIIKEMTKYNFKCIALGSVGKVQNFVDTYGEDILIEAGIKIIEVGFETGDEELSSVMCKAGSNKCENLALTLKLKQIDIFWLNMTFFPGETIRSLNKTGDFMDEYGQPLKQVYGRLATNGTRAGLGQFFLPYEGTKGHKDIEKKGFFLLKAPLRLIPSFIPYSFWNSEIRKINEIQDEDFQWFELYNISKEQVLYFYKHIELEQIKHQSLFQGDPKQPVSERLKPFPFITLITFYALCAKLRIIA